VVSAISPGLIEIPILRGVGSSEDPGQTDELFRDYLAGAATVIPIGRLGQPEEIDIPSEGRVLATGSARKSSLMLALRNSEGASRHCLCITDNTTRTKVCIMTKLLGFSTFLMSTTLSVAALGAGADDPAQRFIDRIIGQPSYSVANSPSVTGDRASDPAAAFLDRWAGKQTPFPKPTGVIDWGDPARDFIDRIAGVPVGYGTNDTRMVTINDAASRLTSLAPRAPAMNHQEKGESSR
jgi:hypothetical protein